MLTRYILKYNTDSVYELQAEDLRNWDEVKGSYKRADYGGVARSFTSKFEFTRGAYDLLMELFDRDGFKAQVTVEMQTMGDDWRFSREFAAELDFSTMTYDSMAMSVNAKDNSLAAVLKSGKGTKFEFSEEEVCDTTYYFDRVEVCEQATYEVTDGDSNDDGSIQGVYTADKCKRLYAGLVSSDLGVGSVMAVNQDQEDTAQGFMLRAKRRCNVHIKTKAVVSRSVGSALLMVWFRNNGRVVCSEVKPNPPVGYKKDGKARVFKSLAELTSYIGGSGIANESLENAWAVVNGEVYLAARQSDNNYTWGASCNAETGAPYTYDEYERIVFENEDELVASKGERIWLKFGSDSMPDGEVPYKYYSTSIELSWKARAEGVTVPAATPDSVLRSLLNAMGCSVDHDISARDPRLAHTLIIPAESLRGISGAKLYTSFTDFCNWMEAVFGYVYTIDNATQKVIFLHRSELFRDDAETIEVTSASGGECKFSTSGLYARVEAGYSKQSYESVNGRDEFNFGVVYSTGIEANDKSLQLISPYRADSYGMEFTAAKRGADTTDSNSDKTVFFAYGDKAGDGYKAARSVALDCDNPTLLNAEFNPMACIRANGRYISMMGQGNSLEMRFASADGAAVAIGEDVIGDAMELPAGFCTLGELTFTCDRTDVPADLGAMLKVELAGIRYTGYIREMTQSFARPEAADVTIMIKTKERCY